jgi:predicted deacetylase
MSDLRANPKDVCMSDSMPFAQRWTARTTWPLADVLNDDYFLNMRQTLRAGDTIRISRFDRNDSNDRDAKLLETCEVIIVSSGPTAKAVKLAVIGQLILLAEGPPMGEFEVRRGQAGKFKLMRGDEVLEEFGSKAEAEAAMTKKIAA